MFKGIGLRLTGSYAAVPANGPAANESQPHPLPGLRCSAALRGPKRQHRSDDLRAVTHVIELGCYPWA